MKVFKNIALLFLVVTAMGCEDFLEVEEVGRSSIPVFFKDVDGIRAALPGAYSKVYDYYDANFMLYPDAAGDLFNMIPAGEETKMYNQFHYQSTPQEEIGAVGHIWRDAYEALANVNNILEYQPILLEEFPSSAQELQLIKGDALFLRALIHFDLVRVYAQPYHFTPDASHLGIPVLLQTPGPDDNFARNSVAEVYEQVLRDLEMAGELLAPYTNWDSYHASTEAVEALMARVYLYKGEWAMARDYANTVIGKTSLARGEDYLSMFRELGEGEEAIFRLNGHLKGSAVADFYTPAGPTGYASQKLLDLLKEEGEEQEDLRLQLFETKGNTSATLKYHLTGLSEEEWQVDLFVLRASEMYLIRAEANAQLNNLEAAVEDLKVIQARALQLPVSEIELQVSSKDEVLNLILEERGKEFSFEGHRLFDLTRMKQDLERPASVNSNLTTLAYPSPYFVLPIPETEVNANENITQNPEY